jgi:hypothetical protein
VPGPSQNPIRLDEHLSRSYCDLAGLIARSDDRGYKPNYYTGAHPVFLMCVLRIADYLQIQSGRAN